MPQPKRNRCCNEILKLDKYLNDINNIKSLLNIKHINSVVHITITQEYINYLQNILINVYFDKLNNYQKKLLIIKKYKLQLDYFINIVYKKVVKKIRLIKFINFSKNNAVNIFSSIDAYNHPYIVIIINNTTFSLFKLAKFILNNISINFNFNNNIINNHYQHVYDLLDYSLQRKGNNCSKCKAYFDYIVSYNKIRKIPCTCCPMIKIVKTCIKDIKTKLINNSNNLSDKLIISIRHKINEVEDFIKNKLKSYEEIQTVHLLKLQKDFHIYILKSYINTLNDINKQLVNLNNDYSLLEELLYS